MPFIAARLAAIRDLRRHHRRLRWPGRPGRYIFDGLARRDFGAVLGGSILVAVLSIVGEVLLILVGRFVSRAAGPEGAPRHRQGCSAPERRA